MKIIRLVSFLSIALIISACGNLRIKAYQTYQAPAEAENLVVTGFYIAPTELPRAPKADAEAFKKKVKKLNERINTELEARSDAYAQTLAAGLEMQLNINTLYGEEVAKLPRYDRLKRKEDREALIVNKKNLFPEVKFPEAGLQLFGLEKGDLKTYLEESPRLRSAVRGATKGLNCELIAFGHGRLVVDKVTTYGEKANIRLLVDIYIYDDGGQLAGHAYGETEPITITGEDFSDYRQVMDAYTALQGEILTALTYVEAEDVDDDEDEDEDEEE